MTPEYCHHLEYLHLIKALDAERKEGTEGSRQHNLNCGTYEDVITLAVKHSGIRIRPEADNSFAVKVSPMLYGGKMNLKVSCDREKKNYHH